MPATIIPLIDGALYGDPRTRRQQMVEAMAADLARWDAWRIEQDAFRALVWATDDDGRQKYSSFDVATCLADARQAAAQTIVAEEMIRS
jgi:hypothetical protein